METGNRSRESGKDKREVIKDKSRKRKEKDSVCLGLHVLLHFIVIIDRFYIADWRHEHVATVGEDLAWIIHKICKTLMQYINFIRVTVALNFKQSFSKKGDPSTKCCFRNFPG